MGGYSGLSYPWIPLEEWVTKELSMVGRLMTTAVRDSFLPTSLRVSAALGTGERGTG
jgi:hypothetical protein